MREIRLFYKDLSSKGVGHKLAIRDQLQIKRLKALKAGYNEYNYSIIDLEGTIVNVDLLKITKQGGLFEIKEKQRIIDQEEEKTKGGIVIASRKLYFPIIKKPRLEEAISQVTQLNFYDEIVLYFSDHSRYTQKKFSENKIERLERIALSAFLQSFSRKLPKISLINGLVDDIQNKSTENNFYFIPDTKAKKIDLDKYISSGFFNKFEGDMITLNLVIGPEGGFSEKERLFFQKLFSLDKAFMCSFGDSVLTSETAAIVFTTIQHLIFHI